MPQFQMNGASAPSFATLPGFVQGYIEAMFFIECEAGSCQHATGNERQWNPETDSSLPGDVGFVGLDPAAVVKAQADCAAFQKEAADLLQAAYGGGTRDGEESYDDTQAAGSRDAYLGDDGKVYIQ
jgi:hypothetical protein